MKLTSISSIVLGASLAFAAAIDILNKRFVLTGFPTDSINCPDHRVPPDGTSVFRSAYVSENIDSILSHNEKKGQYPKKFRSNNPNAGDFIWRNGCTSDKVLELPLWKNPAGNETLWWDNTKFNNNNRPGLFREYCLFDGATATFCGAYAHADSRTNGRFVSCSY